jgi:hypothetical protein
MNELLKGLAKARQLEELTKKAKQDAVAEFEASPFFQALQFNHAEAVAKTLELTEQLRSDGLDIYNLDGEKKPSHGGFEIKVGKKIVFNVDPNVIRDWCFDNFRPALKLDFKKVEDAAKSGDLPTDFSSVEDEPKVYIKTDLSKFLEEE